LKRALLDINVLIALFDPQHAFHGRAHAWFGSNAVFGWSSCPLTENGLVRILSNPNYSKICRLSPSDVIGRFNRFRDHTDHQFWFDDISLGDAAIFDASRIHSSRQLTDIYLTGLAVKRGGRLATFDQGISLSTVKSASGDHLTVI
jgi:toxin-antitoxin system PIN domain toxin